MQNVLPFFSYLASDFLLYVCACFRLKYRWEWDCGDKGEKSLRLLLHSTVKHKLNYLTESSYLFLHIENPEDDVPTQPSFTIDSDCLSLIRQVKPKSQ